ncbi:hypothetical protein PsYK624_038380 [Phanerochaete sordida]|uniref:Uncharacterized protein n=1 Tax=Phanerochaete sordida TaxID=48140 RepID=A0A9P3G4L5_9APHY|nr:hypothetical protein PsYK624_038380 [Phanerochaete sordida]
MHISFNPGIGTYTVLHVPEVGDAHLRFTASFQSREALEQARCEGIRVEMWTNMPVNGGHGDWHAVPFVYPEDPAAEQSADFTLAPTADAPAGNGRDMYLDMVVPGSLCGARYSFTYRLDRPWGGLEWLGAWGHNGDLVIERREERFVPAEGCFLKDGVVVRGGEAEGAPAIQLKEPLNWSIWSFDEEGWATYSSRVDTPASKAVVLLPRLTGDFSFRRISQPIFLSAGSEPSSAVSVSAEGEVLGHNASKLTILALDAADFVDKARELLPGLVFTDKRDGYAIFKSHIVEASAPASISVVPVICTGANRETRLTYDDLLAECPHISKEKTILVDVAQPAFITVPTEHSDLSVKIGPYGGNFILTPLHVLEQASEEVPWNLAILSPSSFARIATETSGEELARLLPTPPPSPPPTIASLTSSSSFQSNASRSNGMSITLPSIAEVVAKEMEQAGADTQAVPLTPLSPPPRPEGAFEEKSEKAAEPVKESERQVTSPASRSQPIRGGFMRLLFAWIFRSVIARLFGFFAPVARYWGLPTSWFYEEESKTQSATSREPVVEKNEDRIEPVPVNDVDRDDEDAQGEDRVYLSTYDSVGPTASPSETTLAESDDDDLPEKEHYVPSKLEVAPSMETVVQVLEERPAPVFIAPRAPPKPRFLADISSNTVSLLVRAPHARRAPSDLKIHLGGKAVAAGDAGYTCARVSEHVFLLGLQGPQEGGRLEIAVD